MDCHKWQMQGGNSFMSFNKDSQVGARVNPWVKEIIKRNGYSISDAVTYFADCLRKDNPRLAGEIKLACLEKELKKTQKKIQELYFQEEEIKEEIQQLKLMLDSLPEQSSQEVEEWAADVEIVQQAVDKYSGSKEEKLDRCIMMNGDMFIRLHKKYPSKSWKMFKEELLDSLV